MLLYKGFNDKTAEQFCRFVDCIVYENLDFGKKLMYVFMNTIVLLHLIFFIFSIEQYKYIIIDTLIFFKELETSL